MKNLNPKNLWFPNKFKSFFNEAFFLPSMVTTGKDRTCLLKSRTSSDSVSERPRVPESLYTWDSARAASSEREHTQISAREQTLGWAASLAALGTEQAALCSGRAALERPAALTHADPQAPAGGR